MRMLVKTLGTLGAAPTAGEWDDEDNDCPDWYRDCRWERAWRRWNHRG